MLPLRYVDEDFRVQLRLVHMGMYASAFNNRQLAGTLNDLLATQLRLPSNSCLQLMQDRAEYGLLAADTMIGMLGKAAPMNCLSHTLDHCGEHMSTPYSTQFLSTLNTLMAHSHVAKAAWLNLTGKTWKRRSPTRWWSAFETDISVAKHLDKIESLLQHNRLQDTATVKQMKALWTPDFQAIVAFELTVLEAAATTFVQTTYQLEANTAESNFIAFDLLDRLSTAKTVLLPDMQYPEIRKVAYKMAIEDQSPPAKASQVRDSTFNTSNTAHCYQHQACIAFAR